MKKKDRSMQQLGKRSGRKRLQEGGVEAFSEMGKLSWSGPSDKRRAMLLIRVAHRSVKAAKKNSLAGKKIKCTSCKTKIIEPRFYCPDYNHPFYLKIVCEACLTRHKNDDKTRKITEKTAVKLTGYFDKLTLENETLPPYYWIVANALGYPGQRHPEDYYGMK